MARNRIFDTARKENPHGKYMQSLYATQSPPPSLPLKQQLALWAVLSARIPLSTDSQSRISMSNLNLNLNLESRATVGWGCRRRGTPGQPPRLSPPPPPRVATGRSATLRPRTGSRGLPYAISVPDTA
eukprot:2993205-Rhodomonas_salina.4